MSTNFDRFLKSPDMCEIAQVGIVAEKNLQIEANGCIATCRRALEAAIRWVYEQDPELPVKETPNYWTQIHKLVSNPAFERKMPAWVYIGIQYILETGNKSIHNMDEYSANNACVVLFYLYSFFDWIQKEYDPDHYEPVPFVFSEANRYQNGPDEHTRRMEEYKKKAQMAHAGADTLKQELMSCKKKSHHTSRRLEVAFTMVALFVVGLSVYMLSI